MVTYLMSNRRTRGVAGGKAAADTSTAERPSYRAAATQAAWRRPGGGRGVLVAVAAAVAVSIFCQGRAGSRGVSDQWFSVTHLRSSFRHLEETRKRERAWSGVLISKNVFMTSLHSRLEES